MANAGQMTNTRYIDLTYMVAEHEEEEELRDFSRVSKNTKAELNHSSYACIGSATCLKQKNIRKLFPQSLKQMELNNKLNVATTKAKTQNSSDVNNKSTDVTSGKNYDRNSVTLEYSVLSGKA